MARKRNMVSQLLAAVGLGVTLTLTGCGSSPSAGSSIGNTIKIGYLTPLTGFASTYGKLQQIAVQMAVEEVNNSGGINGAKLELVTEDSPFNPNQAVTLFKKVSNENVLAIIGPFSSGEWEVASPLANQLKVPAINAAATKPGITAAPWSFRIASTDADMIPTALDALKKLHPNVKNVVIVGDIKEATTAAVVKTIYPKVAPTKGLNVIDTVTYETGLKDFSQVVSKIKNDHPDALLTANLLNEAVGLAKELKRQQVNVPVVATQHIWTGAFISTIGDEANGWITTGWSDNDPNSSNEKMRAFVKEFQNRAAKDSSLPQPGPIGNVTGAYDTIMILAKIMKDNHITPTTPVQEAREKIQQGLKNLKNYSGLIPGITFKDDGEAVVPIYAFIADTQHHLWKRVW